MKQICYSPHFYRNSFCWGLDCQDLPFNKSLIDWVLNGKKGPINKKWTRYLKGIDDLVVKEVPDNYFVTDWLEEIDKLGGDELRLEVLEKAKSLQCEGKDVIFKFGWSERSVYAYIWKAYSLIAYTLPVNYDMRRFIPELKEDSNLDYLIQIYDEKVRCNSER